MADANVTVTVDTANSPWVMADGRVTTVFEQSEAFVMRLLDLGTTGIWEGGGGANQNKLALANGEKITFGKDRRNTHLGTFVNATAKTNPGSFWVEEDNGRAYEVKVTTATIADANGTGNNNITTITFEYVGKPFQWTWENIKMA